MTAESIGCGASALACGPAESCSARWSESGPNTHKAAETAARAAVAPATIRGKARPMRKDGLVGQEPAFRVLERRHVSPGRAGMLFMGFSRVRTIERGRSVGVQTGERNDKSRADAVTF